MHILTLLLPLLMAHAEDCRLPKGTPLLLIGEDHGTEADERVRVQMFEKAGAGEWRVFFEAIPREANTDAKLRETYA